MPVMNTCQQGVNQGSTVSDRNPSPLMIISGGVWHTYDVTRPEHEIPRLGLKHPRGCVQQVNTSLVLNYLVIIPRTQQSSLLSVICDHSIVESPVVQPPQTPSTRTIIVGCTQSVSVPIRALSGEYVLIHGTQQSSLPSAICNSSIVASPVVEPPRTPSTGTIVGCTKSVSVPIRALL